MSGDSSDSRERIINALEALIGQEAVSEDYVRFRIEVFRAQTAVGRALPDDPLPPELEAAIAKRGDRSPVLNPDWLPFPERPVRQLLNDLAVVLQRQGGRSEDVKRLSVVPPELLEELVRTAAFAPDVGALSTLGERLGMDSDTLLFFGRVSAAPLVDHVVRRLRQHVARPKPSGHCPWCGSEPALAVLRGEQGRRLLFCSLCSQRWEFDRVQCVGCGSRAELGRLAEGPDDRCAIETCDACNRYLKTVDTRNEPEQPTALPLVETTATLHLDLIAQRRGYAPGLPYVAMR